MKKIYIRLLYTYYLFCIFFKASADTIQEKTEPADEPEKLCITVFVHGIFSPKPYLSVGNVLKFFRDKIADSIYARSIEHTRHDPFFYQHHPMQGLGLHKVDNSNANKGAAAQAYAHLFDMVEAYSSKKNKNIYYTFGWSGLLSPRMRYLEAKIFYDQLLKELATYHAQNQSFKLRVIGYSHGGNVALRLAEVYEKENYEKDKKIKIDELILIGAPVLPETDYLTNSSIFQKIYHFYSYGDRIQCLDFFSLDRVFSNRKFLDRSDFAVPDKLVHIQIKVKRPVASHQIKTFRAEEIPYLIHHKSTMRNSDPGHTELWSFGWVPSSYRKSFALYPLPIAIFIPYILAQLEQIMPQSNNVMVELHPSYEHMVFYDYQNKYEKIAPFLSKNQFTTLKEQAEQFRPVNLTRYEYDKRVQESIIKAQQEILEEWQHEQALKNEKRHVVRTRFHRRRRSSIESC